MAVNQFIHGNAPCNAASFTASKFAVKPVRNNVDVTSLTAPIQHTRIGWFPFFFGSHYQEKSQSYGTESQLRGISHLRNAPYYWALLAQAGASPSVRFPNILTRMSAIRCPRPVFMNLRAIIKAVTISQIRLLFIALSASLILSEASLAPPENVNA